MDDRTSVLKSLAERIKTFLPKPDAPAEPFWAIMEVNQDGRVTGSFYAPEKILPLFLSRDDADFVCRMANKIKPDQWEVRGVSKALLGCLLDFEDYGWIKLSIGFMEHSQLCCFMPPSGSFRDVLNDLGKWHRSKR